jgi:hypothetical protein
MQNIVVNSGLQPVIDTRRIDVVIKNQNYVNGYAGMLHN